MPESRSWKVGDSRSITHQFTRAEIDAFARLTGDTNPLHVDADFANRTAAGGQVVHGMLAASLVSTLIGVHIPGRGALWNSFQVNWRRMIRIGDRLRFDARVTSVQDGTRSLDLDIVGVHAESGEVYLDGKARVMMIEANAEPRTTPLTGKRVLVTGASGEVGGAICRALAEAGCEVVMWGRTSDRLMRAAAAIGATSPSIVDLMDDTQVDKALKQALDGGVVHGLVHAAAAEMKYLEFSDPAGQELLARHLQIEVSAFHRIAQSLSGQMPAGGFVIAVLSQATLDTPPAKSAAYVAAKMGAWGLVRAMAAELGANGIRCNAVSPGLIETPYVRDMPVRVKQVEAASNPMRRLCSVDDVAQAVRFLAGPDAGFLNGVNLPVTGGARMP
jgi:3-oxoacyl-[acyl-carrier protein] reductase